MNTKKEASNTIDECKKLLSANQKNLYRIGVLIDTICKKAFWEGRIHQSWDSFCRRELQLSPYYANVLVHISREFTEEEVIRHSVAKLRHIGVLPANRRGPLLKMAREGATAGEIDLAVRALRDAEGIPFRKSLDGSDRGAKRTKVTFLANRRNDLQRLKIKFFRLSSEDQRKFLSEAIAIVYGGCRRVKALREAMERDAA
jgi:hypothetical protein